MKKFFIILSCILFVNSILDTENIELDIERLGENSVKISWSIKYEEYDRITYRSQLQIEQHRLTLKVLEQDFA